MKHKINKVAAAVLLASSLPVSAEMCSNFNPYVGADAQYRYMPFEKDFGGNIFKKTSPQANFFVGNRFNEYFGLELGYNTSKKVKRNVRLSQGQSVAGAEPLPAGEFYEISSKSKISGIHASVLGFLPLCDVVNGLEAIGSVGLARLKLKSTFTFLISDLGPVDPPNRTFSAHRTVVRLSAGAQYKIVDNLAIRAMVHWENTKRFQYLSAKESINPRLRLKNSVVYSLGLNYSFN